MGLIPGSGGSCGGEDDNPLYRDDNPSILVWEIPWTGKPGGLQTMGLQSLTCLVTEHASLLKFNPILIKQCMYIGNMQTFSKYDSEKFLPHFIFTTTTPFLDFSSQRQPLLYFPVSSSIDTCKHTHSRIYTSPLFTVKVHILYTLFCILLFWFIGSGSVILSVTNHSLTNLLLMDTFRLGSVSWLQAVFFSHK